MTRRTLTRIFREERGVALPVALAVLFSTAGLATVAARGAIVADHQSLRDRNAKRAIQAAQAGLADAIYQTNVLQPASTQCVVKNVSTGALSNAAVQADGWCAPQTEDLGDGAQYTQRVSQATSVMVSGLRYDQRQVVSTGTVNGVKRRATVTINAATGDPLFPPGYAITTQNSITMMNNSQIIGGLGSNGNITLKNNSSVCGDLTAGVGKKLTVGNNTTQCPGYSTANATTPFVFQPVDQGTSRTVNDNIRITRAITNSSTTPKDACSGCNKITLDSNRVLKVNSGGVLTLTGDVYNFCRLELNGGTIQIAARTTPMRIYIDTPENCGGGSGMGSVELKSSSEWVNLSNNPAMVLLMVAGSPTKATKVDISSNDKQGSNDVSLAIYAPNSDISYKNNLNFVGAIVAKSITLMNNSKITLDSRVNDLNSGSNSRFYQGTNYKECASDPSSSVPNSAC